MPRPKSPPSYCIHTRSNRAYTTIEGRQIQLGAASSPESQQAFRQDIGEWYANGEQLPPGSTGGKRSAHRDGPSVAVLLERYWTHAQGYYSRPVLDDAGQPKADAGIGLTEPTEQLNHYRQVIRLTRRAYGDTDILKFGCPQLEASERDDDSAQDRSGDRRGRSGVVPKARQPPSRTRQAHLRLGRDQGACAGGGVSHAPTTARPAHRQERGEGEGVSAPGAGREGPGGGQARQQADCGDDPDAAIVRDAS